MHRDANQNRPRRMVATLPNSRCKIHRRSRPSMLLVIVAMLALTTRPNKCHSFSIPPVTDRAALNGITDVTTLRKDDVNMSSNLLQKHTMSTNNVFDSTIHKPIVVYTIAGSDSGGGAGIQADLKTILNFRCHGCSIITCLTAQNSVAVTEVHTPPISFLRLQWDTIYSDIKPYAIKIGMLGSKDIVMTIGTLLKELREKEQQLQLQEPTHKQRKVWIVLDPVMISTSGSRLIDLDAQQALIEHVFPYVDIITPNLYEAQALLGLSNRIDTYEDMETVATKLLQIGCNAVLLKGGHFSQPTNESSHGNGESQSTLVDEPTTARDYLLIRSRTTKENSSEQDRRLCDADVVITTSMIEGSSSLTDKKGVWIESVRYDTVHTHGTGCTLSAALASALAIGENARSGLSDGGANMAMNLVDATCLAKAYVTAGISQSQALDGAQGPGPVAHTNFPNSFRYYPTIHKSGLSRLSTKGSFVKFSQYTHENQNDLNCSDVLLSRVLPIVDSVDWIERLCAVKQRYPEVTFNDVQLRIKNEIDPDRILDTVLRAQKLCASANIRLWINDYWEAAITANCFGVHLGQEDLYRCIADGGIERMRQTNKMAIGVSTHTYGELAAALGINTSYISLGPIFSTGSKKVQFEPQGIDTLHQWRQLVPPYVPLIAIGGINGVDIANEVRAAGADCIAVIGAVTKNKDCDAIAQSILRLEQAMLN